MNGNSYELDTNTVLYVLNGNRDIAKIVEGNNLYLSFISELELLGYQKIAQEDKIIIEKFISECSVVGYNSSIKQNTIELRQKYKIKLPDALIAATAQFLELPLITADKGFSKIEKIKLLLLEL